MQKKNKNGSLSPDDFIRYRENKMTGTERNAFEKELQRDPFAEEAASGLSTISADEAADDFEDLKRILKGRTLKRKRIIYYRAAAVLTALVVISTLIILKRPEENRLAISENLEREVPVKIPVPIQEPEKILSPEAVPASAKKAVQEQKQSVAEVRNEKTEAAVAGEEESKEFEIKADKVAEPAAAIKSEKGVAAAVFDAGNKIPEAQSSQVSLKAKWASVMNYIPPVPVTGRDSFDLYLDNNIRNPEPDRTGQHIVSLIFLVKRDSTLSGIRIISSPGDNYTTEAIRLIKEGPKWSPAMNNNGIVEDSARVDIIFK